MIAKSILPYIITSQIILQSVWQNHECATPPIAIYLVKNGSQNTIYNNIQTRAPTNKCGSSPFKIDKECCHVSLDPKSTRKYQSVTQFEIPQFEFNQLPESTLNQDYCHVKWRESAEGIGETYYLANGKCIDDFYQCLGNGLYQFFSPNCQGSSILWNAQLLNTTIETVTLVNIKEASAKTVWKGWIQIEMAYFTLSTPLEWFLLISLVCAASLSLFITLFTLHRYYLVPNKFFRALVISNTAWLVWISVEMVLWLSKFPNRNWLAVYAQCRATLFNIASVGSVLTSAEILFILQDSTNEIKLYYRILIAFVHVIFAGSNYFHYFLIHGIYESSIRNWIFLFPFWLVFMFVFDTIPAYYFLRIVWHTNENSRDFFDQLRNLLKRNYMFGILSIAQLLLKLLSLSIVVLQYYTLALGSDRQKYCLNGPLDLLLIGHASFSCVFVLTVVVPELRRRMRPPPRLPPTTPPISPFETVKQVTEDPISSKMYLQFESMKQSKTPKEMDAESPQWSFSQHQSAPLEWKKKFH